MYPVIYMNCDLEKRYDKFNFFSRIRDNLSTTLVGESFIKELGLRIAHVELPPNFNKKAYLHNMENARRYGTKGKGVLSPKTLRLYDYRVMNFFQRQLMAYSVVKSVQLLLRTGKKSIKNSCILLYDALNEISIEVLKELAKHASYIILLSDRLEKLVKVSDSIAAEYGIAPVVTNDVKYAVEAADFIITTKEITVSGETPVWYINNGYVPVDPGNIVINDVCFRVPWNDVDSEMPPELLGGILSQMEEKDIERSLKYNGIYLDKIMFNDKMIDI